MIQSVKTYQAMKLVEKRYTRHQGAARRVLDGTSIRYM